MKETFSKQTSSKNGLKKSLSIAKARFFAWIRAIVYIVHNFTEVQSIINHQNKEIEEMRLLVNFLLKNTNRFIRRRWIRYLDTAEEIGIWDSKIVKLCPSDRIPTGKDLSQYLDELKEFHPDKVVIGVDLAIPNTEPIEIKPDLRGPDPDYVEYYSRQLDNGDSK
jgi:hypothetical protein